MCIYINTYTYIYRTGKIHFTVKDSSDVSQFILVTFGILLVTNFLIRDISLHHSLCYLLRCIQVYWVFLPSLPLCLLTVYLPCLSFVYRFIILTWVYIVSNIIYCYQMCVRIFCLQQSYVFCCS